jgi:hypothetical protein
MSGRKVNHRAVEHTPLMLAKNVSTNDKRPLFGSILAPSNRYGVMMRPRGLSNGFGAADVMFPALDLEPQVSFGGSGGPAVADVDLQLGGHPSSSLQFISNNSVENLAMYG